jgi:hypothetical protein
MILLRDVPPRFAWSAGGMEHTMADIRDEPALESVGVDPDAPIAQASPDEPGQKDEDDDEFDDDEDEADEEEESDDEDDGTQKASDTETE